MNAPSRENGSSFRLKSRARATLNAVMRLSLALALCSMMLLTGPASVFAQKVGTRTTIKPTSAPHAGTTRSSRPVPPAIPSRQEQDGSITAGRVESDGPIQVSTSALMRDQEARGAEVAKVPRLRKPRVEPDRKFLPGAPGALEAPQWPLPVESGSKRPRGLVGGRAGSRETTPLSPQTLGTQFDGATGPTETGAFPPDTMGAIGPTQFFVFLNGRMRTFNETTGVADGVINADPDVFFASVMTQPPPGEIVFTSDPNVRYDRFSGRWFITIIDVVLVAATGAISRPNRVLIGVSDAASNGNITGSTVWTLYQFQGDATLFTDYTSLGVDASALYIGGDMFTTAGAFNSTKGFVIPKAPLLTASPLIVWTFSGLVATPTGAGPFAPRGVDNLDAANTGPTAVGYFIGVDNATFDTLMLRRVTDPGALVLPGPTMSANISILLPLTTRFPVLVPHLGNTAGTGGRLDGLDDRLYAAMTHSNNRLWTAHNIGVNNTGVAGATNNRNAARWYEIQNINAAASVLQSGTLFDNSATNDANQRNYWIPSIAVSGQGHAALGASIGGTNERVNAFTTGRLVGDTLGALREGPGGAAIPGYTASASAYNPPGDPGGPSRRWGDYSFTSLDPIDDMTMWTVQEYCNGTNTYGVRAVKLIAPPPATPSSASNSVRAGKTTAFVTITGTQVSGSGFYDPGANLAPPALPFTHINATVSGGVTVNSVTYNSPTSITLNLNTSAASTGLKNVTVTNPDGQSLTGNNVLNVLPTITGTQLIISEFRLHGSNVTTPANDEFVELYNNTDLPLNISETALVAITGGLPSVKFNVPANTTLPRRGHYLIVGSTYSLSGSAAADGALLTPIADDSGLAVFDNPVTFTSTDRLDSVGFSNVTDANYFEGTKLSPAAGVTADGEYSFVRKIPLGTRLPQDTGDNNNDFTFVSTTGGVFSTRASILGAPGPENLASPLHRSLAQVTDFLLDQTTGATAPPNRVRNALSYADMITPSGPNGGPPATDPYTLGTLSLRRRFVNNTGGNVTRLRFRIVDLTTRPSPPGTADLRSLSIGSLVVAGVMDSATCAATGTPATPPCMVTVSGLTLEQPPTQGSGGGLNSTLSAGTITLGTPLVPGASINVQFLFGAVQTGSYRAFITVEALP